MAKPRAGRLLREERRRETLSMLERNGRVTVPELARRFGVSAVTVRADLDVLARNGGIVRSHGGAVKPLGGAADYPLAVKQALHHHEKVRIARAAVALIQPNETVILDSGTTTLELALHLKQQKGIEGLTVITHSLSVATALADSPHLMLVLIGGILRHVAGSFVGPDAERMMAGIHADHFFLAVDGLDPVVGLTTTDILEAKLNALMIEAARETTVIADSSKLGRKSVSVIAGVKQARRLITDRQAPGDIVAQLRERKMEVLLV